jgi:membrane protease YdiL (CAAX protease family)
MVLLFFVLPLGMVPIAREIPRLFVLLCGALLCALSLLHDRRFHPRRLGWNRTGSRPFLKRLAVRVTGLALALSAVQLAIDPSGAWSFPRRETFAWAAFALIYPVLSAYPQELIYRTFFFHRYGGVFRNRARLIWASSLAFAVMHLVFQNAVAPLLSLPAGYLFATTYARTRSTLAAGIEHALIGNLVFAVGMGAYFGRA